METKQAQHTPGKWYVGGRYIFSEEGGDQTLAEFFGPQADENLCLAAAAPELLQALKNLCGIVHEHKADLSSYDLRFLQFAMEAVSKAEGK